MQPSDSDWVGLSYMIAGECFTTSLTEIVEILKITQLTPIPGAHPWIRGLSQIHGKLLPVYDLQAFLMKEMPHVKEPFQVMVTVHEGQWIGILMDRIEGFKHFSKDMWHSKASEENAWTPYVSGVYRLGEKVWNVLHVSTLLQKSTLLEVN